MSHLLARIPCHVQVLAICLNRPAPKPPTGRPAPTVRTAAPRRSRGSLGGFGAARSLKTEVRKLQVTGDRHEVTIEY